MDAANQQDPDYPVEKKRRLSSYQDLASSSTSTLWTSTDGGQIIMDNSAEVVAKMAAIYAERLMSDVQLVVGDEVLPAHRLILCASSDVFQVMFMDSKWTESQEKKIVLKESTACAAVFQTFLKYLYTGKVCVDFANVIPLLQLADKYNVTDLLKVGLDFMSRNVPQAGNKNQVVSWYQFTTNCGYSTVSSLCLDFIKWNYETVSHSIDWCNIESESLVNLLNSSDIVVHDEMVVFNSVETWLTETEERMMKEGENNIDLHMQRLTQATVSCVRFPMMTPSQVADLLLSPLTKHHMAFMVERMSGAMAYHRGQATATSTILSWKNGDRMLTPRLYTQDKFCANLSIDYFSQLPMYHCRSLYFSAFESVVDSAGVESQQTDWMVDIYPKGVWIQPCYAIFTSGAMKEVPDKVLRTVRASVSMKENTEKRVKIGILIVANENGYEHIGHARTANYIFSEEEQIVNFDNLLGFDPLNDRKFKSKFLSGTNRDSLKIYVTITPLHKLGSLDIP